MKSTVTAAVGSPLGQISSTRFKTPLKTLAGTVSRGSAW
jgi:hypothetical protein